MTEDSLKALKERYQNILKIKESIQKLEKMKKDLLNQKEKLETNPIVLQYLSILDNIKEVENDISKINNDYGDDEKILQKALEGMYISETNGIYVYAGAYRILDDGTRVETVSDSPLARYNVYIDVEKPYNEEEIRVPIRYNAKFVMGNTILYPWNKTPFLLHQQAQEIFFKTCIESTQEEAIQKVLELENSQKV